MAKQNSPVNTETLQSQFLAIVALAFNYYQQGKLQEAETIFRGLQLLNPKLYYSYAGLGAIAMSQKPPNLSEAYQNLSKAAELNPRSVFMCRAAKPTLTRSSHAAM